MNVLRKRKRRRDMQNATHSTKNTLIRHTTMAMISVCRNMRGKSSTCLSVNSCT